MKRVITVTSVGTTETEVEFGAVYPYVWIENQGESDCYAANYSGFTAQSVDVVLIKAGTSKRIDAKTKNVYVKTASGTTTLEVHGQNDAISPFKKQGKGGEQITVESLTATENATYTAPAGTAYSPVTVSVPIPSGLIITNFGLYDFEPVLVEAE